MVTHLTVWLVETENASYLTEKQIRPVFFSDCLVRGGPIFRTGFSILSVKGFRWVGGLKKTCLKGLSDFKNPST